MNDTPTRKALVAANKELHYLEAGGESEFRTVEEGRVEVTRLREKLAIEEHAELVSRREQLRHDLIEADVEQDVAYTAWQSARERYAQLKREASTVEMRLRMAENDQKAPL